MPHACISAVHRGGLERLRKSHVCTVAVVTIVQHVQDQVYKELFNLTKSPFSVRGSIRGNKRQGLTWENYYAPPLGWRHFLPLRLKQGRPLNTSRSRHHRQWTFGAPASTEQSTWKRIFIKTAAMTERSEERR